jgi:hypothetical protein
MKILSQTRFLRTMVLMACAIAAMPSQSLKAQTIPGYDPPPETEPTMRDGSNCSEVKPKLLLPAAKKVITTAAYPTFLFFVPETSASKVLFVLNDVEEQTTSYHFFTLPKRGGILRVALTMDKTSEIKVGQPYQWSFVLICGKYLRPDDYSIGGKLQRVVRSDNSNPPASQMSLWERYRAFEYDALVVLDALRRANPKDRVIQAEWETWLERYKLGDLKEFPPIEPK